jgi:hypothetical protein
MACTCNAICDNDCGANQICTGHVPACSNTFTFTGISIGSLVRASDLLALQTAINNERADTGRRFNASEPAYCYTHTPGDRACTNNSFSPTSWIGGVSIGQPVLSSHYNDLKNSNNQVVSNSGYGGVVIATFTGVIRAVDVTELQTKINQTRNACICDSHCNCDPSDCGCNGECPSDDYYYYYP